MTRITTLAFVVLVAVAAASCGGDSVADTANQLVEPTTTSSGSEAETASELTEPTPTSTDVEISVVLPEVPILGTVWTLDIFYDDQIEGPGAGMEAVKLTLTDDGVTAAGRCWAISGFSAVEQEEGNLSIDFSTADPGFSCYDRDFFEPMMERLNSTHGYLIDGQALTLNDGAGPSLGFTSIPPTVTTLPDAPEETVSASGEGCDYEFAGEDLTGNRSNGLPSDRLQVVAFYDGAPESTPQLKIELHGGTWLTVGGNAPGGSIEGFGRSIETREYILYGCVPTGEVEVLGVAGNGVVDGLAFGLLWRHADGGLVMLKSNPPADAGAAAYVGMWPLGWSRETFAERTPQITDPFGRESARVIITGAALVENGSYSIASPN